MTVPCKRCGSTERGKPTANNRLGSCLACQRVRNNSRPKHGNCSTCGVLGPITRGDCSKCRKVYLAAYYIENKARLKENGKKWVAKNKTRVRLTSLEARRRRDGLPKPTRPMPYTCELCGGLPNGPSAATGTLCIDHCHSTGAFRGWLCFGCNTGIGRLGDTVSGVQRALDYLKRSEDVSGGGNAIIFGTTYSTRSYQ